MRALMHLVIPQDKNGVFLSNEAIRQELQALGLRPPDMPKPPDDAAESARFSYEESVRTYCVTLAQPILERMPKNTPEEQERRGFAEKNIFYASYLASSNTVFMVTRQTDGAARLRLLNPKIEDLQEGCVEFAEMVEGLRSRKTPQAIRMAPVVKIFEHGLEESTISGTLVRGIRRKWQYVRKRAGLEIVISAVTGGLFLVSFLLTVSGVISSDSVLRDHLDRFSTAMLTSAIVSAISVIHSYRTMPVIQWSASYEESAF